MEIGLTRPPGGRTRSFRFDFGLRESMSALTDVLLPTSGYSAAQLGPGRGGNQGGSRKQNFV